MRLVDFVVSPKRALRFLIPSVAVWDDRKWWRDQHGYYIDNDRQKLHRAIYESVFGPPPSGYHVHHFDEDSQNNHFCNLLALPPGKHMSLTAASYPRTEEHRRKVGASNREHWKRKPGVECTCHQCNGKFISKAMARPSRFCSTKCGNAWRTNRFVGEDRKCDACGATYRARNRVQRFCSKACNHTVNNFFTAKARQPRDVTCGQCGVIFISKRHNARFCDRECAVAFHDTNRGRRKIADAG